MNYKEVFEKANDAIYIHEIETGRVVAVNQRATELTGFSKEELTSASPEEMVSDHPDFTFEHALRYMQKAAQGESQLFEWLGKRKDGTTTWYEVNLIRATIDGMDRILAFFHEINDRKKAQQDLEEFNKTLEIKVEQRTQELADLNRELESFTYSVSHDLRAPLRSINGYAQMLIEDYKDKLDVEGQRIIQTIGNNAKRMGTLIDELLEFSRLGRKEIQKSGVDLKQLVDRTIGEVCRVTACKAQVTVGKMYEVQADYNLLYQVVFNLISNAIKYSSKKENPKVEIYCERNETEEVVLHVKDNGVGFDMQYADKLFGVFQRLHARHEFEGTGVGLAIVHRIIARHKGKVWAHAKKDNGAIFSFSLPKE
jgi:PAS domain S-box-containing protein